MNDISGSGVWSSESADSTNYLIIDLGETKNITTIATQGRGHTREYVTEYRIEFGNNNLDYSDFKDASGYTKVCPRAWMPTVNNFYETITVDLKRKTMIIAIATQGLAYSQNFVTEYIVSYGTDGSDWSTHKSKYGNDQIFKGNSDGKSVKKNVFETPIVARYIRINPILWVAKISMRIELYGCDYVAETIGFKGNSLVKMDLRDRKISSLREIIRLRIKTNDADGIILYSRGSQHDILALQLSDNKLVLSVQLGGSGFITSLSVGSLLDDNFWHDVVIQRNGKHLTFSVDTFVVKETMLTDYRYLNLNREIYIGGIPNFNQDGLIVKKNFTGCIENLFINGTNIVEKVKDESYDFTNVNVIKSCVEEQIVPITFKSRKSFIQLKSYETPSFNISFDFRTFEEIGALLYHKFYTDGDIKLFIEKGLLIIEAKDRNSMNRIDTMFDQKMNDGRWHSTSLIVSENHIELVIDGRPSVTTRLFSMKTGNMFVIGGNMPGYVGFLGCMRKIYVENNKIHPMSLSSTDFSDDLLFDVCQMIDRCSPNPCKHGGTCEQIWNDFKCDCEGTGYSGAVCHTSRNSLSCDDYRVANPTSTKAEIDIDVDGSGPLKPFPVKCVFHQNGVTETFVGHSNEQPTQVNGFNAPGSFIQDIIYNAGMDEIVQLVNRSHSCKQFIKYRCHKSRLFREDSDVSTVTPDFKPFSWWVSRDNKKMDYWGGSQPGTQKCGCGMRVDCFNPRRWCNCDSVTNDWKTDEGFIYDKDYLPVRQLRFGDTGLVTDDKKGEFTLGQLICEKDKLFENQISFRKDDAVLKLPTFDMGYYGDIYFQFKTTQERGVFLHSRGPTDSIKLFLSNGNEIQFKFKMGAMTIGVPATTTYSLNDNEWHSVLVEKNQKEARVIIDGKVTSEVKATQGATESILLTSPMYVGSSADGKDGYVGCFRSLVLNGEMVNIKERAERGVYGIVPGCVGRCDSSPCLNNGTCTEHYNRYTCNCRFTAFTGPICADEIGSYLKRGNYIKYDFVTMLNTIHEHIRIGFLTTKAKGLLFAISSHSGEYFNLILANSGHLRVVFDYGFERQEMIVPDRNLANGQHHDIRIERSDEGSKLSIYIDNYEPFVKTYQFDSNQDNQLNQLKSIYLGGNESMSENDMFEGCISRVEFNEFYILNLLYQEDKPGNVKAFPGAIPPNDCEIEAVTHPPEPIEEKELQDLDPVVEGSVTSIASSGPIIYGVVLAVLLIILILVLILIGRYVSRQKGEYKTHEDIGSKNAPDADTAILHSQTGHGVKKDHEYFI
ncbi:Neurexin-4 [Nymphon striatum]|nr:Neurexin-4 [Nymphon striatum]